MTACHEGMLWERLPLPRARDGSSIQRKTEHAAEQVGASGQQADHATGKHTHARLLSIGYPGLNVSRCYNGLNWLSPGLYVILRQLT